MELDTALMKYARWLKFLREKQADFQGQLARMEKKRRPGGELGQTPPAAPMTFLEVALAGQSALQPIPGNAPTIGATAPMPANTLLAAPLPDKLPLPSELDEDALIVSLKEDDTPPDAAPFDDDEAVTSAKPAQNNNDDDLT